MSRAEGVAHLNSIEFVEGEETPDEMTAYLRVLAHDLRNPLASLQGCAQTLVSRGEGLSPKVRAGLADVIARQAERMDWLVRAVAALAGVGSRWPSWVDLDEAVKDAATFCGVTVSASDLGRVQADPSRIRLGLEALFLAFEGAEIRVDGERRELEVEGSGADGNWKIELARRVLGAEGLDVKIGEEGVRVGFGATDRSVGA